jgi:hypothetical protein
VVWALWLFGAPNLYSQESSAIVTSANRKRERAAWIYVGKGGGEEISKILTVSSLYDFYQKPTLEYKKSTRIVAEFDPMFRIRIQLGQLIRIGNPDLNPGRPKLSHKKVKKMKKFRVEKP